MSKVVFIKENSEEVRQKLKDAGYSVCCCAEFADSAWLDHHPDSKHLYRDMHGTGYASEDDVNDGLTPLQRIEKHLTWDGWYSEEKEFFDTVDEFLSAYPSPQKEV